LRVSANDFTKTRKLVDEANGEVQDEEVVGVGVAAVVVEMGWA